MREIAILGATGSIGTQALDVIARHSGDFRVSALTAHSNANELFAYVRRFRPRFAGAGFSETDASEPAFSADFTGSAGCTAAFSPSAGLFSGFSAERTGAAPSGADALAGT